MNKPVKKTKTATKVKNERGLTILQQAATNAILSGIATNWTQAARIAGYKGNENTLNQRSIELVRHSKIQKVIQDHKAKTAQKVGITEEKIANEYAKIAFADFSSFLKKGNEIKDLSDLPPELTACVESISTDKSGKVTIKLHSKLQALNDLGKHLNFFKADNDSKAESIVDVFASVMASKSRHAKLVNSNIVASPTAHELPEPIPSTGLDVDCKPTSLPDGLQEQDIGMLNQDSDETGGG
jgi:phage terminase small subunit